MKRYHFGVLLLCLSAPACSKHRGTYADESRAAEQAGERPAQKATSRAQETYSEAKERQEAAEQERIELPPVREERETAATRGGVPSETRPSAARELPYGSSPGAEAAPGTTRAVTPAQGAAGTPEGMQGAEARDETKEVPEQGPSESDRRITQRIRRALLEDDALSYSAKNVQIITRDGNITLRGLVMSDKERREIERKARSYAGSGKVDNQLEVKSKPLPRYTD